MLAGSESAGIDLSELGCAHRLAGGEIRNAAMKEIFLADVRGQLLAAPLLGQIRPSGTVRDRPPFETGAEDRGLNLRAADNRLQELLKDHLRALFLKEIHVLEAPQPRKISRASGRLCRWPCSASPV